jgi:phosphate transport system ATP-binding protein
MEGSPPETDASTSTPIAPLAITAREQTDVTARDVVFELRDLDVYYGQTLAVSGVNMRVYKNVITAMIGPSGCGKSTVVRTLNRMNDSIAGFNVTGGVLYHGHDLYGSGVDPVEVRRRIGMVFQRPNPFPKSIYDNIAWAPRILGLKSGLDERVEQALRGAALWDEVKDRLKGSAAAAVHRPCDRDRAGCAAARRAVLGA